MSSYPVPPPTYGSTSPTKPNREEERDAFLGGSSSSNANAYFSQTEMGDVPDDFKYGVTVSESAAEIRHAFVRKVYSILFCQILATVIVSGSISQSVGAMSWIQNNIWSIYVSMIGTFVVLGLLFWKRHAHPWNLVWLSTFTVMEAFTLGFIVAFYETTVVLQALLITLFVFGALTLFTLQSKYEFDGMGPFLFAGLMALVFTGFLNIFIPFNSTVELIYALVGCLLFSGYIVYDTYMINRRMSPDEWVMGSLALYLDFINLFLNILKLLNNVNDR